MLESIDHKSDYFELAAARSQHAQLSLIKDSLSMWCGGALTVRELNRRLQKLGYFGTIDDHGADLRTLVTISINNGVWSLTTYANLQVLHIPIEPAFVGEITHHGDDQIEVRSLCELIEAEQHAVIMRYIDKLGCPDVLKDIILAAYDYKASEDVFEFLYRYTRSITKANHETTTKDAQ